MSLLQQSIQAAIRFFAITGVLQLFFCIIPAENPPESFTFTSTSPDTISSFSSLSLVFSQQVNDSSPIRYTLTPRHIGYYAKLNKFRDTSTIVFTEPLSGSSRYVVRITDTIHARDNTLMVPQKDSLVFFTYPLEQEPNGDTVKADILTFQCFGTCSTLKDHDVFRIDDTTARRVVVTSYFSHEHIEVLTDAHPGSTTAGDLKDTLLISTTPVFIVVYAAQKAAGGYYKIHLVY